MKNLLSYSVGGCLGFSGVQTAATCRTKFGHTKLPTYNLSNDDTRASAPDDLSCSVMHTLLFPCLFPSVSCVCVRVIVSLSLTLPVSLLIYPSLAASTRSLYTALSSPVAERESQTTTAPTCAATDDRLAALFTSQPSRVA